MNNTHDPTPTAQAAGSAMTAHDLHITARVLRSIAREIESEIRQECFLVRWWKGNPAETIRPMAALIQDRADRASDAESIGWDIPV
jgi:hypothetical protein